MKIKKLYITLLLILIWSFSFSQQYTNYTTKDGLPSNHVYRITQDYQGFIWFITDKGMVKYNGTTFKTFTTKEGLPTNDIWDIRIGHDNKMWFFTKSTALGYIENDIVYTFESNQKNEILYPRIINQNQNNIFFADTKKVFYLKNNRWDSQGIKNSIVEYLEPIDHQRIKGLVTTFKQDTLKIINHENNVIKIFNVSESIVNHKYRGQLNDSLFCWISQKSLHLLNLNTLKFKGISYEFGARKFVRYSAVNNQIQFSGESFISFLDANFQLSNTIQIPKDLNSHFSFVDKNKNLWIATVTNGVYFLPYAKQKAHYSLSQQKVGKIQKVNTNIIASVYKKGFYKYDTTAQNEFQPFLKINDFNYSATYIEELNTYYYNSDSQSVEVKKNIETIYEIEDNVRNIIYYNNFLYGNTSFGIIKINPKNYTFIQEYNENGVRDIILFKNKIFIASASGIKQFYNDKISSVPIGRNAFNKPITSLSKFNENQLIIGTDGFGAYITDLNIIEQLEQSEYLNIQSSFIDGNSIWLATNKGVWHYKKEGKITKLVRKYTTNDGLSLNQINDIYVIENKIIASSNDGISIIPINQKDNNQFIDLYFDEVTYNNNAITNNQVKYSANNHLEVKIASIDFSNDKKLVYEYQLLPIQKKWNTTSSNQISFADLSPNKYELNIRSNNKKNTVKFVISPLWYQTIAFKVALLFLGLVILYLFSRWNQKRTEKIEKEKAALQQKRIEQELYALRSQMNPHFVFNSLSAIQYYINDNDFETSEEYLIKFSQLIRRFFELSKEQEISLKEEISLLKNYLEIEKLRFKEKLSFEINIDDKLNIDDVNIPTMLLQPIIENAVNHGIFNKIENGLVSINFSKNGTKSYQVEIIDDGVGVVNTAVRSGNRKNSSMVLKEKLHYLNEHQNWKITYRAEELHPTKKDKGNLVRFTITRL